MNLLPMQFEDVARLSVLAADGGPWLWSAEALAASVQSDHLCLYAVHQGTQIGYCVLSNNGVALEVLNIVVFRNYQRRRLGTALLDAISAQAGQSGLSALWLEVRDDNLPALELYRSYGFVEQGRRANYYGSVDAINMACALIIVG